MEVSFSVPVYAGTGIVYRDTTADALSSLEVSHSLLLQAMQLTPDIGISDS